MLRFYSIYEIINPANHVYVGVSVDVIRRFREYRFFNGNKQPALFNSFRKYGVINHQFIVICSKLTVEQASKIEKELVSFYKQNKVSLNSCGGGLHSVMGSNSPLSIPIVQLDLNGNLIKTWDCAKSIKRAFNCAEGLIGNACRNGYRTNYALGFLWQYKSDYLNKVPLKINPKLRGVIQFSLDGEFIKRWESASEASRVIGVKSCSISSACNSCYNSNYSKGYLWLWEKDSLMGKKPYYPDYLPRRIIRNQFSEKL
jgi:predicted GIY-YIG superfamily endonuclease